MCLQHRLPPAIAAAPGGEELGWKGDFLENVSFPLQDGVSGIFALFRSKPREPSQAERGSLALAVPGRRRWDCSRALITRQGTEEKKSSLKLHLRKAALRVVWPRKRTGKAWKSPFPPAPCALGLGDAVGHQRGRSQWGQLRPHSPDTASGIIPWSATSGKGSIALENLGGSCPLP